MPFAAPQQLIDEIARGGMVILIDDENRENEGDLIVAAELITPQQVNFLATHARGLICAPLGSEIVERLDLPPMLEEPSEPDECAFTMSVDGREGNSTGISVFDRARTLRLLADPGSVPADFNRPGHIFPLKAHPQGLASRQGHTEASVHLMRCAGLQPAAVICEVMNEDGSMARSPDLLRFAEEHGLLIGTIESLIEEHRDGDVIASPSTSEEMFAACEMRSLSSAQLPTPFGIFEIESWSAGSGEPITVLRQGNLGHVEGEEPPLVRVHSACFTGDVLGSLRCDCGAQLHMALEAIGSRERGALLYLPQEGRGIGLASKIEAYHLQQMEGLDTVEANERLGFPPDLREYLEASQVLLKLGGSRVRLLTNNPAKVDGLVAGGVEVVERIPIEPKPGPVNLSYLRAKKDKLGHLFEAI